MFTRKLSDSEIAALPEDLREIYHAWASTKTFDEQGNVVTGQKEKTPEELEAEKKKKQTEEESKSITDFLATLDETQRGILDTYVRAHVREAVLDIKTKLDGAYQSRDQATTKLAAIEAEKRKAEIDALEKAGKWEDAQKAREAEWQRERQELQNENVRLTRDTEVSRLLTGVDFRNSRASEIAADEIKKLLVQGKDNTWASADGKSIAATVTTFLETPDNAFLLKSKANSGEDDATKNSKQNKATTGVKPGSNAAHIQATLEKLNLPITL